MLQNTKAVGPMPCGFFRASSSMAARTSGSRGTARSSPVLVPFSLSSCSLHECRTRSLSVSISRTWSGQHLPETKPCTHSGEVPDVGAFMQPGLGKELTNFIFDEHAPLFRLAAELHEPFTWIRRDI